MIIITKDDTELVIPVGLGPNISDASSNLNGNVQNE